MRVCQKTNSCVSIRRAPELTIINEAESSGRYAFPMPVITAPDRTNRRFSRADDSRVSTLLVLLGLVLLLWYRPDASAAPFDPDWGTVGVFTDAATCGTCHRASTDQDPAIPALMRDPLQDSGADISPSGQWQHSMMAHAFNDPYYRAVVEDEVSVFPSLAGLIEDTCLRCHSPMAHTHAHQTGTDLVQDASCTLVDGCYRFSTAAQQDHAREGISCTLCHQVKSDNLGTAASFSGNFSIADANDIDAFTVYGPYQNPHSGGATVMFNNSGYTPQFGGQVTTSGHCASCHTLFTSTIDVDTGTPTGSQFLEQGPFLEWQNSVYFKVPAREQQCQDCHMPDPAPGSYQTRIATRPNGTVNTQWPERSPFFTHSMVGGNTYMLELLRDNRSALEIDATTSVAGFDEKILETRDLLTNRTADLAVTQAVKNGNEAIIDVRITNRAGHKLPSGYPSRRMWLHVTVRDAANNVIFESGAPNASGQLSTDAGRLTVDCLARTKPPGFTNSGCFEPHRDIIDDPAQVAIYETVLGDTNDHITHVLLHANSYLKDNRIPPEGFLNGDAVTIEAQTLPVGVGGDGDFNAINAVEGTGSDTVHYRVALNDPNSNHTVDVRLLFQSVQPAFIEGMHAAGSQVTAFKQMVAQSPPRVEIIAEVNAAIAAATAAAGSSGGGCTLGRDMPVDPVLPALVLFALGYLGLRFRVRARD